MNTQLDITNHNSQNIPTDEIYRRFNDFIFNHDIKLVGKMLHRFKAFLQVRHLAGDIVEVGVFKGSGIATFMKFIDIFCPNSNKKVIGFDIFDVDESLFLLQNKDSTQDKNTMSAVFSKVDKSELSEAAVWGRLEQVSVRARDRVKLVKGDVEQTLPIFLEENPGFRASLIYIDVDLERPTYATLKYLWDRLLPKGIVLFDEYEYHVFSESCGVDRFFRERSMPYNVVTTDWIAPTAMIVKN